MIKARLAATLVGGGAMLATMLGAGTVQAAAPSTPHTVTMTQVQHAFVDDQGFNPCTGDPITLTGDGTVVNHVTYFTGSDEVWGTFTETGAVSFVDNAVSYAGRVTVWGNFNLNRTNGNDTFTLAVRAVGSDGSVVIAHLVTHEMLDSEGNVVTSWEKAPVLTCG
jgi:hypothetical protein